MISGKDLKRLGVIINVTFPVFSFSSVVVRVGLWLILALLMFLLNQLSCFATDTHRHTQKHGDNRETNLNRCFLGKDLKRSGIS